MHARQTGLSVTASAITFMLLLGLSACGAGGQPPRILVERSDSAGVEIVTSAAGSISRPSSPLRSSGMRSKSGSW